MFSKTQSAVTFVELLRYLPGNNNSEWVFKRALRRDRPNAVDRLRPDKAKTVNAAFA
jgi:hypothetical protein